MKIRPDDHTDLDGDVWMAIEVFREVLRERTRADRSLTDRARELLGMRTRFSDIDEIQEELFGDLDVPADVQAHVDQAAEYVEDNDDRRAREYLREEVGSVCDKEDPADYVVSDTGRFSHCHRHESEYQSPSEFTPYPER